MATKYPDEYHRNNQTDESAFDRQVSSENSSNLNPNQVNRLISLRQLSDSRNPTTCILLFENGMSSEISFLEYYGTRARNHHSYKLYLPQVVHNSNNKASSDDIYNEFSNSIKQVLSEIPSNELSSYIVSVRTGVIYFFSKIFRFKNIYSSEEIYDIIHKKVPTTDYRYYFQRQNNNNNNNNNYQIDDGLRSSFSNVKPINETRKFVEELEKNQFFVQRSKHVFRIYLKSADKQTHVCIVDPASNYSIVEFSKDFHRTSNIDIIRDRSASKFGKTKTYDDIFDFRIQFQYNPHTYSDQLNTIEYELHQEFPLLDENFKNEFILNPMENTDQEFYISKQLCPYIQFIRRDFGDVYQYKGSDELFENFSIYLESPVEYSIDRQQCVCKPALETHGLVYAKLDLSTMISSNVINESLLVAKLWDMGTGLTSIAGECTTPETQQSTKYYSINGDSYTAEDEKLVQQILKQSRLCFMLGLPSYANSNQIHQDFERIDNQLANKWNFIRSGNIARDKLHTTYEQFCQKQN